MLKRTILPKVEINTPNGKVTLVNAQIVNIGPYVPHRTPERSDPPSGFVAGVYAVPDSTGKPGRRNLHEEEEVQITFQRIDVTWPSKGDKTMKDDWSISG